MEYEIVRMEAAHVPQIAALERSAFPDPWSESSVASELDNPLSLWLVAQAGGEVLGYVGSQSVMGEADMMNLAVLPAARRRVRQWIKDFVNSPLHARLAIGSFVCVRET